MAWPLVKDFFAASPREDLKNPVFNGRYLLFSVTFEPAPLGFFFDELLRRKEEPYLKMQNNILFDASIKPDDASSASRYKFMAKLMNEALELRLIRKSIVQTPPPKKK